MLERRLHPRYRAAWTVEISRGDDASFAATMSDVSMASFAMSTSRSAVVQLARGGGLLLPGDQLRLRFDDGVDWPADCVPFQAHVRQVRRVSQTTYVIGGEFVMLTAAQRAALRQGIDLLAAHAAC